MRARDIVIKNIKLYREKNNITQEDLSLRIGKKKDFIQKLEAHYYKKSIPIDTLEKIANNLNVTPVDLMIE